MGGGSYRLKSIRKTALIFLLIITLISVILINKSEAKYQVGKVYEDILSGNVKNDIADFNLVSIYINGEKSLDNQVPINGYLLDLENTKCTLNGQELSNITFKYELGKIGVYGISEAKTKCNFYFTNKNMASEIIIANNGGRENIKDIGSTFANTSCDNEIALANSLNTDKVACLEQVNGLFKTQDNYGETFYFRGSVNNNWVKFGQTSDNQDIWWRIIRINGDDTVRLIYSGVGGPTTVGDGTQIAADQFNTSGSDNAYVGYMYGDINSDSYAKTHENKYDSKVKKILDSWYQTNLTEETQYIDGATGFCGDRGMPKYSFKANGTYGILGYAKNQTWYAPAERNWGNEPRPTLKCNQENDLYTSKSANWGNKALQYPIGLITVDEVVYSGGIMYKQNYGYWLCTNKSYWTMSPSDYFPGSSVAFVFPLLEDGQFGTAGYGHVTKPGMGIRPVINLKASVSISGKGLIDNPYTVEV